MPKFIGLKLQQLFYCLLWFPWVWNSGMTGLCGSAFGSITEEQSDCGYSCKRDGGAGAAGDSRGISFSSCSLRPFPYGPTTWMSLDFLLAWQPQGDRLFM